MNKVTFEGISFNADWAASISEKEFVKHEAHHGLTVDQLKQAHSLCKTSISPAQVPAAEPKP